MCVCVCGDLNVRVWQGVCMYVCVDVFLQECVDVFGCVFCVSVCMCL